jgi:aspartyl-tRNA(Asn)/glutamyl-tRNA(Gln) amidotransferase subunit A
VSVDCATILDAVLADIPGDPIAPPPLRGIRLGIPQPVALDRLDAPVASAFDAAVTTLSKDGASVAEVAIPELEELPAINAKGGFSAPEYYAWHRELIADRSHYYDPRILRLILRGRDMSAEEYLDLLRLRKSMIDRVRPKTDPFDAMILPTVPIVAPRIDQLDDDAEYLRVNLAILRNTRLANFLDRCAISIPCHRKGEMPVGLMLMGARGADRKLLAIAMSVEAVVSPAPS